MTWERGPGVVELPDGACLRGRALRAGDPPEPLPEWALYLVGAGLTARPEPDRWLRWPDFWIPLNSGEARSAFQEAHRLAASGRRVDVACRGGVGRTGTALACIAQLGGVRAEDAVEWVRANYHHRAIETPWQRHYVRRFTVPGVDSS